MRKAFIIVFGSLLLLGIGFWVGRGLAPAELDEQGGEAYRTVEQAAQLITSHYVDGVEIDAITQEALDGMMRSLDAHSGYIGADQMQRVQESLDGSFEGIGITYEFIEGPQGQDTLSVLSVVPGGPSDEAGLRSGDRILEVDDSSAVGLTPREVEAIFKGPTGTEVTVAVHGPGADAPREVTITRDEIPLETVDAAFMLEDGIGYIRLNRFASTTYREVTDALTRLQAEGMERLVLDLRGNAGGVMQMAVRVADEFLGEGQRIVSAESRHQQYEQADYASANGLFQEGPLMVLVDEHSASASEIVAGALQDHDRALVVGAPTYGKGLVQKQFDFDDGSALRMTIARFLTPSGRAIEPTEDRADAVAHRDSASDRQDIAEQAPDSLRYTTMGGRTIVGGGGILPDYTVADERPAVMRHVEQHDLAARFVRDWYAQHGDTLRASWGGDEDQFVDAFGVDAAMQDAFIEYIENNSNEISGPNDRLHAHWSQIDAQLKRHLAERLFGSEAGFRVAAPHDPALQEALRYWSEATELADRFVERM